MRLLAVALLAVVLALSSATNVSASQWIQYETGPPFGAVAVANGVYYGVKFDAGMPYARVLTVRVAMICRNNSGCGLFEIYILGSDGQTPWGAPFTVNVPWNNNIWKFHDAVVPGVVVVPGVFWIVISDPTSPSQIDLCVVLGGGSGHSYFQNPSSFPLTVQSEDDYAIRAEVDPAGPVGGVVIPANKFAIVAPWLVIIGLVGCIGTVVVVAKKRR